MDILNQNLYFLIFQFILKIPLSTCDTTVTETTFSIQSANYRRQYGGKLQKNKYSIQNKTFPTIRRTAPFRDTYEEQCDFISKYCLRNYKTARLCGRTLFYKYQTFESYCMLDYVNCREKYEVWQIVHMGECYTPKKLTEYNHQQYQNDHFLDTDYVVDESQWVW